MRRSIFVLLFMGLFWTLTPGLTHGHASKTLPAKSFMANLRTARAATLELHPPSKHKSRAAEAPPSESKPPTETGEIAPQEPTEPVVEEPEQLPPFRELLFAHMHNKLIHFPIAFGLAGALFVWLGLKWKEFEPAAKILWLLGALFAIAAFFTGRAQAEAFQESFLEEVVELHEKLGITTMLSLWAGFFLLLIPKLKRFAWLWALVVLGLITVTAFYGGVVAHT